MPRVKLNDRFDASLVAARRAGDVAALLDKKRMDVISVALKGCHLGWGSSDVNFYRHMIKLYSLAR